MNINKKIIEYLEKKGISQAELAKKIGISNTSLNRSLNSDDLKLSLLIKICQGLKVSANVFFDGSETFSNEEIIALKEENELLKRQLKIFTAKYEDEEHKNKNLHLLIKSSFSIDPEKAKESLHTLRIISKYLDGDIAESKENFDF